MSVFANWLYRFELEYVRGKTEHIQPFVSTHLRDRLMQWVNIYAIVNYIQIVIVIQFTTH